MAEDYVAALHAESKAIISQERQQDMANMYILLRPVSANLMPFVTEFLHHVTEEGMQRLNDISGESVR